MSDHFPIVIDVEEKAVGSVLRLLNSTPGIVTIHLQLANSSAQAAKQLVQNAALPAPVKKERKAYRMNDGGSDSLRLTIAKALSKAPLHLNVLREILQRTGYSGMSLHSCITKMLQLKLIQRTAPGTYKLTTKGERKYIGSVSKPSKTQNYRVADNTTGVRGLVLNGLADKNMSQDELRDALILKGYSSANMYNGVKLLREEGLIKKENDVYEITSRGREVIAAAVNDPIIGGEVLENEQHIGETA